MSLCYNSQNGNSVYGYGWTLSGISAISRASNDAFHDGKTRGISFDNDDAYYLDGVRLIKISTESDFILYQSETGFIKAKGYYSGDILRFFEVFYPDGRRANYGWSSNTDNSLQYPLTTVTDLFDNRIVYSYSISDNHYYIHKIEYNGSYISFRYKNRSDSIPAYRAGIKLTEPKLLEEITCYTGDKIPIYLTLLFYDWLCIMIKFVIIILLHVQIIFVIL